MIENIWYEYGVSDKTVSLLCKWIEKRTHIVNGPFLPMHSQRFIINKKYNKNGVAIYSMNILEGVEHGRSTSPKAFTNIDEFGYAFYCLDDEDILIILSFIDPMNELESRKEWINYLKGFNIKKCDERLVCAMVKLQKEAEKRELVPSIEGEIRGWANIAAFLRCSIPTAMKLAIEKKLPISRLGTEVYSTETVLRNFLMERLETAPIWKTTKKKKKRDGRNKDGTV